LISVSLHRCTEGDGLLEESLALYSPVIKKSKLEEEESAKDRSLYGDISQIFQREGDRDLLDYLLTFTPRFLPPLYKKEFDEENGIDLYKEEIVELKIWTKKNKPNGDWARRVGGVRDLLILQQRGILKEIMEEFLG